MKVRFSDKVKSLLSDRENVPVFMKALIEGAKDGYQESFMLGDRKFSFKLVENPRIPKN